MRIEEARLPGLKIITPQVMNDQRGSFLEAWHRARYLDAGLPEFVQFNISTSKQGVVRGLHGQNPTPQGKLVMALSGRIWDVAVDARIGSPTFGQWQAVILDESERRQFFIPPGFLHGFLVLSESATVAYLTTDHYDSAGDFAVNWSDPELAIEWPLDLEPCLSQKDLSAPKLSELDRSRLIPFV